METTSLGLAGLFVIEPDRSADANGRYSYSYSEKEFAACGAASHYVQEHASFYPQRHTVRGLHFGGALAKGEPTGNDVAGEVVSAWLDKRFDLSPPI